MKSVCFKYVLYCFFYICIHLCWFFFFKEKPTAPAATSESPTTLQNPNPSKCWLILKHKKFYSVLIIST